MYHPFSECLHDWQCFYGLTGEVAGTLIGLMFIAMSLGNQRFAEHSPAVESGAALFKVQTFFSPTLIHLASVVAIAAVISMPIKTPECLSLCLGAIGLAGVAYGVVTFRRITRHARDKVMGAEHWLFHFYLPTLCYLTALITGIALYWTQAALFALAASVVLFLGVGIRNSWSATLYITGLMGNANQNQKR